MFGKKKNKTFDRGKKLDVKMRSQQSRALRMRMAILALAASSLVVLVMLLGWKGREMLLEEYVYKSPTFAIDRIDIQTDGVIPIDQIRRWAAVQIGDSLLKLDLARIKRDLELVPLVKTASVERQLPRRLVLRLKEREPIAQIFVFQSSAQSESLRSTVFFLDEEGWVMPPATKYLNLKFIPNQPQSFPIITGVQGIDLRPGRQVQSRQMRAALQLIRHFPKSPMSGRADIKEIDISDPNTLLLSTEGGSQITFAPANFESQLVRWRTIHDYAFSIERSVAQLNLAVTNYVPVTWVQQESGLQNPAAHSKPSPSTRRKNV
ncbi:MAG: cell division protein FtsQ/DivIB [Verrucomicrobiales bacterium]